MTRILFVCLGNICRSAAAEAVLRAQAQEAGISLEIDSAGTSGWHIGDRPYGPMIETASKRGYQMETQLARRFNANDFTRFDMIFAMDRSDLRNIEKLRPAGNTTPATLFLNESSHLGLTEVPDPYYTRDFDSSLDLIEVATRDLLTRLGAR